MTEKRYDFEPQWIRYGNVTFGDSQNPLHEFQIQMGKVLQKKEDCFFISAPTGAGKTFGFVLPGAMNHSKIRRIKTLIISPTNSLLNQIYGDIEKIKEENPNTFRNLRIAALSRKHIEGKGFFQRGRDVRAKIVNYDVTVSNPDIISLLLSGFYHMGYHGGTEINLAKVRSPESVFSDVDVIFFDEYHYYSEEELGKILAFMQLSTITGNRPKYVFTSATPTRKLVGVVERIGLSVATFDEQILTESNQNSRRIRGDIGLTFTDRSMFKDLNQLEGNNERCLWLFDHKIDAEIAINRLLEMGVPQEEIQEYTARRNRQKEGGSEYTNLEKYIIATNAAEHGLNMQVDRAHIEPGLFLENLVQRYGRIGRRGNDGEIVVHIDKEFMEFLPDTAGSFQELIELLGDLKRKRELYASRILTHFYAYMALCTIRSVKKDLALQIMEKVRTIPDSKGIRKYYVYLEFDKLVRTLTESESYDEDSTELKEWWDTYIISHGFFRGSSSSVNVLIPRVDGSVIKTTEDIVWVERWCRYTKVEEEGAEYLRLDGYLENPSMVKLEYAVGDGTVRLKGKEIWDAIIFRDKFYQKLSKFIEENFRDSGVDVDMVNSALKTVLSSLYPGLLKPLEVGNASENQII